MCWKKKDTSRSGGGRSVAPEEAAYLPRGPGRGPVPPAFASNKGFDVKVHWDVLGGDDGDSDTAGQVLGIWVNNMALPLKDALSEDEHSPDDGFWGDSHST